MRFVWGVLMIVLGTGIIKYTYNIVQTFGTINWAEAHLSGGIGGTYTLWKIIGVGLIFLAFMVMFNMHTVLISPLRGVFGG